MYRKVLTSFCWNTTLSISLSFFRKSSSLVINADKEMGNFLTCVIRLLVFKNLCMSCVWAVYIHCTTLWSFQICFTYTQYLRKLSLSCTWVTWLYLPSIFISLGTTSGLPKTHITVSYCLDYPQKTQFGLKVTKVFFCLKHLPISALQLL